MGSRTTKKIGRFGLVKKLGHGSQGAVYLARDPSLDRYVAIKLLVSNAHAMEEATHDSLQEGRLGSRLTHPNIVPVYEAGELGRLSYLVFEYVEGHTLRELLKTQGALSIPQACEFIKPILDGISHAHLQGVLHLDLNPRNIMVDKAGVPRIMDFGLAQTAGNSRLTKEYAVGTVRYMSPEHFSGDEYGPHTDIFALSLTFTELVTGRPVMQGKSGQSIIEQIVNAPIDLAELRGVSNGEAFARFLEGGLQRDIRLRYHDGAAMKSAFDAFQKESGMSPQASAPNNHSTVDYLMRRMQRKGDFPSLSRTLLDINRLTSEDSQTSADKLANFILRDYALTNKMLKLVNSAFYRGIAGEVTNISQAVVLLGFKQVRMTANSLAFFSHMQGKSGSSELRDSMTRAFLAGLMTRHLAKQLGLVSGEDAFICGLFQNLGESLVAYYFPEEFKEICQLMSSESASKRAASSGVLGVSYGELGSTVARIWKLPDTIVEVTLGLPGEEVTRPANTQDALRDLAVLCNELCEIAGRGDPIKQEEALHRLMARFRPSISMSAATAHRLLASVIEKLDQYAPILEIDVDTSVFYQSAYQWSEWAREQAEVHDATVSIGVAEAQQTNARRAS